MTALAHPDQLVRWPAVVLRPVPESRPPAYRWFEGGNAAATESAREPASEAVAPIPAPTLFDPPEPEPRYAGGATGEPTRLAACRVRWVELPGGERPRADLPDPVGWCRTLAPALVEVLARRRPLGQLARWLDDPVLGALTVSLRLRQRVDAPRPAAGVIHSVRVQCPTPTSVEAGVHVRLPGRSAAMAFRLVAGPGGRWLCTALDLGDATLLGALDGVGVSPAGATRSGRV